jgi:hypothetical protein
MSETKIISNEQLEILRNLNDQYDILTKRYGEIAYEKLVIEQAFLVVESERVEITQKIQTEMGTSGTVDLETGIFSPD